MAKSVKKNFSYNLILTGCNYIFPLIIYPYVSRVLGVENIGVCSYVDSIINYFVLFSMLGVGSLGVREISRCKDDLDLRNKVFSSLLSINLITTVFAVILLVLGTLFIPFLSEYKEYLGIGVIKLVFNAFLIEWFFQGIQEFKYITIRSVAIRILYIVSLFIFVRTKDDTLMYYALTCSITLVNALCNLSYSRRFCSFKFNSISPTLFIVPVLSFGYYRILTSLYTTFNTFYLGTISNNVEVGYFSTASKLNSVIMAVFTAFTTVMVPRVAQMIKDGEKEKVNKIANDTISVIINCSVPLIILCIAYAPTIISIIAGAGYEGAITPFRIVILNLLIIGLEQIVIQQFLMAMTKSKYVTIVSSVGAAIGLSTNFILTPMFASVGSSISWGLAELSVLFVGCMLIKKEGILLHIHEHFLSFICALIYMLPICIFVYFIHNTWLSIGLSTVTTGILFWALTIYIRPCRMIKDTYSSLINKFKVKI